MNNAGLWSALPDDQAERQNDEEDGAQHAKMTPRAIAHDEPALWIEHDALAGEVDAAIAPSTTTMKAKGKVKKRERKVTRSCRNG